MFKLFSLLTILLLTSCVTAGHIYNTIPKTLSSEEVNHKNYDLDQEAYAYVGSEMIRRKQFVQKRVEGNFAIANSQASISGGPIDINISANAKYELAGYFNLDGIDYKVVKIPRPKDGSFGLLLNEDGSVHKKILNEGRGNFVVMYYDFAINPSRLQFNITEQVIIEGKGGPNNFSIIYNGTDGKSINFTYREYTDNDHARTAFFQNLTYPKSSQQIRFRDLVIKIHSADAEKITFTVVKD